MMKGSSRGVAASRAAALGLSAAALAAAGASVWLVRAPLEAAADRAGDARRLAVETVTAEPADAYRVERRFVGRVEAGRTSDAGFELGGRVEAIRVDEGERVSAGDVLARLDTERLEARKRELRASLRQARTERDLARATLERLRAVREAGGASQQEIDEAVERLEAAEARVDLARSRIATVEVDLRKAVLHAPFDAVVTRRHVDEGRVVPQGEPVVSLQERGPRTARIGVAGDAAGALAEGEAHRVVVEGRAMSGRVRAILPVRSTGTRTVDVLVELPAGSARAGDLAVLPVTRRVAAEGFWLPLGALSQNESGLWTALVAEPDGEGGRVLRPRQLTLIHQTGDRAYVDGALEPGARVVASGRHRVVPGQAVVLAGEADRVAGREAGDE